MKKKCVVCGFDKRVENHHIIKHKNLGSDVEENLVYLCPNHHWIADFGNEEDRIWMLEQIKKITGKDGVEIDEHEKKTLFKKARRLVEETLGRYSDEEWENFKMEESFNFITTINGLRGRVGWGGRWETDMNKRAELLLLRDKIDSELGFNLKDKPQGTKQQGDELQIEEKSSLLP